MARLRLSTLRRVALGIFCALFLAIILRWISLVRWDWQMSGAPEISPSLFPTPQPTATRTPVLPARIDLPRLFNGVTVHSELQTAPGGPASEERIDPQSYMLELLLKARVPTPNRSLEELAKVSPELPTLLPGLSAMITPESISPLFAQLYETKVRELRENLTRLDQILSRHNFYDCQTILSLRSPETKRRALFFQADMDVDADGSDGDRVPAGNGAPPTFKPFTSFRWTKKSPQPNPYAGGFEEKLRRVESEQKSASADRRRELKNAATQLRDEIGAMRKYSYLIGVYDPFIVVPGSFLKGNDAVRVGDYAVVVAGGNLYPAIVGDVGPNDKIGEASLRIAKEINTLSNPNNRPISELKATYIVFNGTADSSFGPPDLDKLQARCESFIKEIGGSATPLHRWQNTVPPLPTPTPSPTATPTPTSAPPSIPPTPSPSATFAFPTASSPPSPNEN